jgi:hypothetical protein
MDTNTSPIRIHANIGSAQNEQGHAILSITQRVALTFPKRNILGISNILREIRKDGCQGEDTDLMILLMTGKIP